MRRVLLSLLACCTSEEAAAPAFNREQMVQDLSVTIVDSYAALAAATAVLQASMEADPLPVAQSKWNTAYVAYKHTEAHGFGPADDAFYTRQIATWPVEDTALLDMDAAVVTTVNEANVLGSKRKGFAVLEYALWSGDFEARRAYAAAIAGALHLDVLKLQSAWVNGHAAAFAAGEAPYQNIKSSIDVAFNFFLALSESVASMRFGIPLGKKTGGLIQPLAVESRFSQRSVEHAAATLDGMERMLAGVEGRQGLGAIVAARDATLYQRLRDALDAAQAAVAALSDPLATALSSAPASVRAAEDACRAVRDLLATEVAVAIGITVTFSDNDGD